MFGDAIDDGRGGRSLTTRKKKLPAAQEANEDGGAPPTQRHRPSTGENKMR